MKVDTTLSSKEKRGTCKSFRDKSSKINCITVMDSKPVTMFSTTFGSESKIPMMRWVNDEKKR